MKDIYVWSVAFPDYSERLAAMAGAAWVAFMLADELELI